jgi:PhnB protein
MEERPARQSVSCARLMILNFNGNCSEAVHFYAEVFEVEVTNFMTFGEVPSNPEYPLQMLNSNIVTPLVS